MKKLTHVRKHLRKGKIVKAHMRKSQNDPCWKGYKQKGVKMKGSRTVPNCIPI